MFLIIIIMVIAQHSCTKIFVREDGKAVMIIPDQVLRMERMAMSPHVIYNRDITRPFLNEKVDKQKKKLGKKEGIVSEEDDDIKTEKEKEDDTYEKKETQGMYHLPWESVLILGLLAVICLVVLAIELCMWLKRRRREWMEKYRIDLPVFPKDMYGHTTQS